MTKFDICNIALVKLEDEPISSFGDGTEGGRLCAAVYESARETVLTAHAWSCAARRVSGLPQLSASPDHGYDAAYGLPRDCLKVTKVRSATGTRIRWRREGWLILCDGGASPRVTYTANIGAELMDVPVTNAVAMLVGSLIARRLTGSSTHERLMKDLYDAALADAKALDAVEGSVDVEDGGTWADVV